MFRRPSHEASPLSPVRRAASPVSIRTLRERGSLSGQLDGSESMQSKPLLRSTSPTALNRVPLVTTSFFNRAADPAPFAPPDWKPPSPAPRAPLDQPIVYRPLQQRSTDIVRQRSPDSRGSPHKPSVKRRTQEARYVTKRVSVEAPLVPMLPPEADETPPARKNKQFPRSISDHLPATRSGADSKRVAELESLHLTQVKPRSSSSKSARFVPSSDLQRSPRSGQSSRREHIGDRNVLERIARLQASNDRYRDSVIMSLIDDLRNLESKGKEEPVTIATSIALMRALRSEMQQPIRDVARSLNGSDDAFQKLAQFYSEAHASNKPQGISELNKIQQDCDKMLEGKAPDLVLLQLLAEAIVDGPKDSTFIEEAYATLSVGLTSPKIPPQVRDIAIKSGLLKTTANIINSPTSPPSTKEAAGEFISHFNDSRQGNDHLTKHHPDIVPMKGQVQNLEVMMRVVSRKARKEKRSAEDLTVLPLKASESAIDMDSAGDGFDLKALVNALDNPEKIADPITAQRFADLVVTYTTRKRTKELKEAGAHELLLRMMRHHQDSPEIVARCLDGFAEMADNDSELAEFCAARVPPAVDMLLIGDDENCVRRYVGLLEDLAVYGDTPLVAKMAKTKILSDLDMAEKHATEQDSILLDSIHSVRAALTETADPLTLKAIYGSLMTLQSNGDSINIQQERSVRRMFRFVCRKVAEYGRENCIENGVFGWIGSEFMYGCLSFQLLATVEDNQKMLKLVQIPKLLLDCMAKQEDDQIAQHAILTAVEMAENSKDLAADFVNEPWRRELIVNMLKRGREASENEAYVDVEDLVGARVQLIEKTALTRDTYADTTAVSELINVWDDYDYYFYGNIRVRSMDDLKMVFKQDKKSRVGLRKSLAQKATTLFRHNDDLSTTASPLERRQSARSPPAVSSPLERRKSVVAAQPGEIKSGFARRASQFFNIGDKRGKETGAPHETIAMARRQSMLPSQRRGSFFSPNKAVVPTLDLQARSTPGGRASQLQRRASMANPSDLIGGDEGEHHRAVSARSDLSLKRRESSFRSGAPSMRSEASTLWGDIDFNGEDDSGVFVPRMLEYVFKACRATVGPKDLEELYKRGSVLRLTGLIACPETPPACFAHVLYLVGMLAAYKDCKDGFGEASTVERICSLLRRAYKQQGTHVSETVTNACLALATLVVVHLPNTRRFAKKKGVELTVDVLRARGAYNDSRAVNAASALIGNLCYKNSQMKEKLGEHETCEALVNAMASYQGISGEANSRCVASLFKAVGNLSLNEENMTRFMAADIDKAYASFMGEADEELDNTTIESCLRTLSNLVIEKDNMQRFSIVIVPFLSLLRKERQTSAEVHRWAFITLANLCRWPDNAQSFVKNAGIDTITMLLPYLEESPALWASVIIVLGIQTTHPGNIPILLDSGIFEILSEKLDGFLKLTEENPSSMDRLNGVLGPADPGDENADLSSSILLYSQLPISALRCAHRVLTSRRAAEECVDKKVFQLAQRILKIASYQPMLAYECLRVIFATMSLYGGEALVKASEIARLHETNPSAHADTLFYDPESDWGPRELTLLQEGQSPTGSRIPYTDPTRPEWKLSLPPQVERDYSAEPVWQSLDMAPHLRDLVESVRHIASSPRSTRNIRLQRVALGFLALVATEKVAVPSLFRRLHIPIDPETAAPAQEENRFDDMSGTAFKSPLRRRRSVWDAFKHTRATKPEEKTDGFGRERKPDPTSIIDIVQRTFTNFWYDNDTLDEMCILLNAMIFLCFGREELCLLLADVEVYKQFNAFLDHLPAEKVKPYWLLTCKNYKRFLQTEGKLSPDTYSDMSGSENEGGSKKNGIKKKTIFTARDLGLMRNLMLDQYPLDLSQWHVDPFPDGVMSLKAETRAKLRKGGKAELYQRDGSRHLFLWKAAHDLILLQWKILPLDCKDKDDLDPTYPFDLAASRLTALSPGIAPSFFDNPQHAERSVHTSRCCTVSGPGSPSMPMGVNLAIKFKDQSSRDHFLLMLSHWREACAFGFL